MAAMIEVLAITELLKSIFLYLDEISTICVQRVCTRFHAVFRGSINIEDKVGFIHPTRKVIDIRITPRVANQVKWNPLLDWFSLRCFGLRSTHSRPFKESLAVRPPFSASLLDELATELRIPPIEHYSLLYDIAVTTFLPHALRASREIPSSLHRISATHSPTLSIDIAFLGSSDGPPYEVHSLVQPCGVTIGGIINFCAQMVPSKHRGRMLCLGLPWFMGQLSQCRTAFTVTRSSCIHLEVANRQLEKDLHPAFSMATRSPHWESSAQVRQLSRVLARWWLRTGEDTAWYNVEKAEQDSAVADFLRAIKETYMEASDASNKVADPFYPVWPALAWPTTEGATTNECPYKVEYAAGLMFNRQEMNPQGIHLPFDSAASQEDRSKTATDE